ncbi:hypothetical protein CR51_13590 [Caballeronia megalochromosomata]|nr:hypothetical protein CR51_13590 [Caballeronia megalochromosomata]
MVDADEVPIKLASLILLDRVAFDSSRSESLNHRNVKLGKPRGVLHYRALDCMEVVAVESGFLRYDFDLTVRGVDGLLGSAEWLDA